MAEFKEVLKQFDRMCKAPAGCCDCPLHDPDGVSNKCSIVAFMNDPSNIETKVMDWAAEHPEPVYPTWREYIYDYCVKQNPDLRGCNDYQFVAVFMGQRIPADIAKKLGLKPKEAHK